MLSGFRIAHEHAGEQAHAGVILDEGRGPSGRAEGRRVVHIGDDAAGGAGHAVGEALAVGVADHHPDHAAHVGVVKRIGRLIGADVDEAGALIALPLIVKRSQAVGIAEGRRIGDQELVFGRRSRDRDAAGRRVVGGADGRAGRRGRGFNRALLVGIVGHHADHAADVGVAQGVGGLIGADVDEARARVPLPLIVEGPQTVGVRHGGDRGQHLVFGEGSGDRDAAGVRVIDVGDGRGAGAGRRLREALTVGIADHHADHAAHVGVAEGVGGLIGRAGRDEARAGIALPVVMQRAQTIHVRQGRGVGGQDLVLGRRAGQGDAAGGRVIHGRDGAGGRRGDGFRRALIVGVADDHADHAAHVGVAEGVGGLIGADVDEAGARIALPLVVEGAQTVVVRQGRGVGGQDLIFGRRTGDRGAADRGVIDVGDGAGGGAGRRFHRALLIGVIDHHADHAAHVGVAEGVGGLIGADVDEAAAAVALPLIVKRAEAVRVGDGRHGGQDAVLGGRAGDGGAAGVRVIDVGDGRGGRAGGRLREALAVGIADDHADRSAHVGVPEGVGRLIRRADRDEARAGVALPVVVEGPEPVGVGQGGGVGGQNLVLGRRARHGNAARMRVIDGADGGGGGAGRRLHGAAGVGVIDHHADHAADVGVAERIGRLVVSDVDEAAAAIALPLIVQRAEAVRIRDGRDGGQDAVLGLGSGDGGAAGVRVVHGGQADGHRLCRAGRAGAVRQDDGDGAARGVRRVGGVVVGQGPDEGLGGGRGGVTVQGDGQVGPAGAAGEGADLHALIRDVGT